VLAVATGAAAGATAGQTAEARQRTLRYPDTITVTLATAAPMALGTAPPGRLGMTVRGLSLAEASGHGLDRRGALVTGLADVGLARVAGVRVGDVVLAASGIEITDAAGLEDRVRLWRPDAPLQLTVWRDGRTIELVVAPAAAKP